MRKLVALAIGTILSLLPSQAPAQTQSFSAYVNGLPAASAVNSADLLYLLQSGTSKQVPSSTLYSNISVPIANSGGPLWQRPASVSANAIPFSMIVNQNTVVGGGVGGANYTNEVVSMGWNLSNTVQVPLVAGVAQNFDTWESKFFPGSGSTYVIERHMGLVDTTGTAHRFFTAQLPWDGLGNANVNSFPAGLGFQVDTINFNNWAGTQVIKWNLFGNVAQINNGFIFNINTNNAAEFQQINAAGNAYVHLPFIDGNNNLHIDAPVVVTQAAPTVTTGQIGYGSTTVAASNCGSLAGAAGCIVVNVAGTQRFIPFY